MIDRRHLLHLTAGFAPAMALDVAAAVPTPPDRPVPPASPREARLIWARLVGDLGGRPIFFFTHGTVWGFKPQADDLTVQQFAKRLYGYSGVAARQIFRAPDGRLDIRQKFWAFYRHPETDAITDRIPNPYTGKIDAARPLSGPTAVKPLHPAEPDAAMPYGMRIRRLGTSAIVETSAFARFRSAGTTWYKLEGNLEDYVCRRADLDGGATHVPNFYSQNVIAEWQTWTGMHGVPGHILFKGNGEPLTGLDQVPIDQLAAIDRFYPGTLREVRDWT